MTTSVAIERLALPPHDEDIAGLADVLLDAVDSGAAVSFLGDLTRERAEEWWRSLLGAASDRTIVMVARDDQGIAGTVQVQPAWAPNQPFRGDLVKLMVHRRRRGHGLGAALMHSVERLARESGFTLLTLDAKRGGVADQLYRSLGWTYAGTIPRFALDTDGVTPHDAVIFYKHL